MQNASGEIDVVAFELFNKPQNERSVNRRIDIKKNEKIIKTYQLAKTEFFSLICDRKKM